jgi:hypothetical protein
MSDVKYELSLNVILEDVFIDYLELSMTDSKQIEIDKI